MPERDSCDRGMRRRNSCSGGSASPSPSMARRREHGTADPVRHPCRACWRAANGTSSRLGLEQRVKRAQPVSCCDLYGQRDILRAGAIPEDIVYRNPFFRPEMCGWRVPHDIYVHIAGIDIVRVDADDFYVLEDNVRTPSGVSYMLENREAMMRLFPDLFGDHQRRTGRGLSRQAAVDAALRRTGLRRDRNRPSSCSRRASTTRPITSIRSWPTSWASNSSRAATCSCATMSSTCARRRARAASM